MSRYAQNTAVTVDRSKAEIERTLERYGATAFLSGYDRDANVAWLMFRMKQATVKILIPMPRHEDFDRNDRGRLRKTEAQDLEWRKATRQRWRALALLVKAKLESVASGISTVEKEFLGDILLLSGRTIAEEIAPQIDAAFKEGRMPKQLLSGI